MVGSQDLDTKTEGLGNRQFPSRPLVGCTHEADLWKQATPTTQVEVPTGHHHAKGWGTDSFYATLFGGLIATRLMKEPECCPLEAGNTNHGKRWWCPTFEPLVKLTRNY